MQNKINLGIIGKNFGYHVIYKSFLKNKKYKIKGFSFRTKKTKKTKKIKIPKSVKIYSSWKELILDKKINAVAVAAPPILHKSIIKFAIKNNKHVFCEKPFTCSYKEANFICNLIKRRKNISHMVNYEFAEIDAFLFFKKKIINNIKINRIFLNWFININKGFRANWKENHSKGGGIIFNYVCHSIFYLEFLFGKIASVQTNIFSEKKNKIKILKGIVFFKNGLSAQLNVKLGLIKKKFNPIHQLKISSDKKTYILETNLNSLSDKFKLITSDKNTHKLNKILFKGKKNKDDFRKFVNTEVSFNPQNMFICKSKKKIKNYYEDLFPWLERCEQLFGFENLTGYGLVRIYTFLAERFMPYWFRKNTKSTLMPIIFYDIQKDIK